MTYKASWLWNSFKKQRRSATKCSVLDDDTFVKSVLKKSILSAQNVNLDYWCNDNFSKFDSI